MQRGLDEMGMRLHMPVSSILIRSVTTSQYNDPSNTCFLAMYGPGTRLTGR